MYSYVGGILQRKILQLNMYTVNFKYLLQYKAYDAINFTNSVINTTQIVL